MITTTPAYDVAVYSASRQTFGKIIFDLLDVDAYLDATVTVTSENSFSKKTQTTDQIRDLVGKLATFENNYFLLDGSFKIPPKVGEGSYQVGWWSDLVSDSNGDFSVSQVMTINFTQNQSSIGLTITFDKETNEYAKDFTIVVKNSVGGTIHTENVTNNTDVVYILYQNLPNYRQIIITFTKTANPYRRVRVAEVDFGIVQEYTGKQLINMTVLNEISTLSDVIPYDEIRYTIDNQNKLYNILNSTGYFAYLQRQQKIYPYLGVKKADLSTEYIPMGIYYLNNWKSNEGTLTAEFTGRDRLDILSQSIYLKGKYQSRSLGNLARDILNDAGLTETTDYVVDSALDSITCVGNIEIMSHRNALQLICVAGMAVCYSDRYGVIQVKQLSNTPETHTITLDNIYASPAITLNNLVNTINVDVVNYTARVAPEQVYKGTVTVSGTQNIWVNYNSYPCTGGSASLSVGTLNSQTHYGNAALLNITHTGDTVITINATVCDKSTVQYQLIDPAKLPDELTTAVKIENTLISNATMADNVADWVLAEYQKRYLYTIRWRQNPALEVGDIVTVEDDFGEDKDVRITKQTFNFSGVLSGETNGKAGA